MGMIVVRAENNSVTIFFQAYATAITRISQFTLALLLLDPFDFFNFGGQMI